MNSLCGLTSASWRGLSCSSIKFLKLNFILTGFRVHCFSTRQSHTRQLPKVDPHTSMAEESNAFYVVRKGDIVGIYKSLRECQAQVSSSVCDPSVSVYKGYNLRKETEEYLASCGLKNPLYALSAADLKENLFGSLLPCPFQEPDDLATPPEKSSKTVSSLKRTKDMADNLEVTGSCSIPTEKAAKNIRLGLIPEAQSISQNNKSCVIEFDGASKGNPGKAGAGAILRNPDGSVICRLCEGLGVVTNNVAEYRALILGMKYALKKGFKQIHVQGDSKLVCMQVEDLWQTKNQNMANLCKEVKGLKDSFSSFHIKHVRREFNSDADAQANLAVDLAIGEVKEESG
ncbi:hypothetical protein Cni_G20369 [Canna indica]|uniref:RNase H type-1 domain-containing protein n=1 Tax=Canna indica TaxID=4628 RepID=A0AAQ3KN08_9LILI|nr:hypothetical protein Cni_G20369 [Canna indica]